MKSTTKLTTPDTMQRQPSTPATQLLPARRLAGLLLTLLLLCGVTSEAQATRTVCRVTTAGVSGNSGADWADPKDIVSALNSYSCDDVWVAQGVYFADAYPYNFFVRPNARVYGGFAGNESSSSQSDPWAHVTILSGDREHNDTNTEGNIIDETINDIKGTNSQVVVKMQATPSPTGKITNTTVFDGFTITGGNGLPISGFGGGLICYGVGSGNECSPTLSRLVFIGNEAAFGGALYLNGENNGISSPLITHVVFANNQAIHQNNGQGGALFCDARTSGHCSPTFVDVLFSKNQSDFYAGGMYSDARFGGESIPSLTDVTFDQNSAFYEGGAMLNFGYGGTSSPSLLNVTFSNNSATSGGAMYNLGQLDNSHNPVTEGYSNPTLRNVTFSNNHANASGGAMYNWGANSGHASPTLINVTFSDNSTNAGTKNYGGAMYSTADASGNSDMQLTNVIMWGNTAGTAGSNIYIVDTHFATTVLSIDFSVVEGGNSSIAYDSGAFSSAFTDGLGNQNGDPDLYPLSNNGGLTMTMVPSPAGDAVDNGICSGAPAFDQRGVPRPTGAGCDIGAVEFMDDTIFANGFE